MMINGPCQRCGITGYELSTSGPRFCPECACGSPVGEAQRRRRDNERAVESVQMLAAIALLVKDPGLDNPTARATGEAYLDRSFPGWRARAHYAHPVANV